MILRKPYAFLIKYFRIIHLLLLVPMIYLLNKTNPILSFFRDYVSHNYSTNMVNIAEQYINFFMYIAVLIIIGVIVAIYYLMRQKRKSTKLYFFALLYYIFLFFLITVTYNILSNMEFDLITAQVARAYRDVSVVFVLPQYFFILYTLIRGIGFDIKKFDFANDLKDLEITDIDNEEFEFNINIEGYKAKRTFRRFIREMKYYILENKFIFTCLLVVFFICIGTLIYLNYGVYNKTYYESDKMTHNYLNIQVIDSIVTNRGLNGAILVDGKYYLALQLLIENKTDKDYELDYTNFRLVLNGKDIYPTLDRGEYFIDYGIAYKEEKIKSKTKNYYVLVYEILEEELTSSYTIKILESIDYRVGEIAAKYKNIILNPTILDTMKETNYPLDKIATLKETTLGYTTFKVDEYQFSNRYLYSYPYCYSANNCTKVNDLITLDVGGNIEKTTLFILNTDFNLDHNSIYSQNIKDDQKFYEQFLSLRYVKDGKNYTVSLKNRTTKYMQDTLVFETKEEVARAEHVDLLITIRNQRYVFNLK